MHKKLAANVAVKYTDINGSMPNEGFHTKLHSQITKKALKDKKITIDKANKDEYKRNRALLNNSSNGLPTDEAMSPMLQEMNELNANNPNLCNRSVYNDIIWQNSTNDAINNIGQHNDRFYTFIINGN